MKTRDRTTLLEMLNEATATELFWMLRNRRHHFECRHDSHIAQKFLSNADEALHHIDRLAARIVDLGGMPDFVPDGLSVRSQASHVESQSLSGRIRDCMVGKQLAIENYRNLIRYLGDSDATTCCLLTGILATEEQQADELAEDLIDLHRQRQRKWSWYATDEDHSEHFAVISLLQHEQMAK